MPYYKQGKFVAFFAVMGLAELVLLLAATPTALAATGVIYVNVHAPGPAHDGITWTTAYITLQGGLNAAVSGNQVWVAQGVYTPTQGLTRTATFALKSGVALYGGFAATETLQSQRNWSTHITVLSGDLDGNDRADAHGVVTATANITGNNAYHVVSANSLVAGARLDGFTITGGYANGSGSFGNGGGLMVQDGNGNNLAIANITFSANNTSHDGGGMYEGLTNTTTLNNVLLINNAAYVEGGGLATHGSPTLANVTFQGNNAGLDGGGMYGSASHAALSKVTFMANSSFSVGGGALIENGSNATLTDVTFIANVSSDGAGLFIDASSPTMTNITFSGNTADGNGGGLANYSGSSPRLINALFSGNLANQGGGVYNYASSPSLVNATLSGNEAVYKGFSFSGKGGGLYNANSSKPLLVNSILWGDGAEVSGTEIYNNDISSTVTMIYSDLQWPGGVYSGAGNIKADPLFVAPITATAAPTTTGNYRLQRGSPAINAGLNVSVTVSTDLDGHPRIIGSKVDMGAYESALRVYVPLTMRNAP
jgi:hypothetical protein